MADDPASPPHLPDPNERFRCYIDESGDHTWELLADPARRYLCLLGCWFKGADYRQFHADLEQLKQEHLPHNPDEPLVLHRSDILNAKGQFWRLADPVVRRDFDHSLLALCERARFLMTAVVIDKAALLERYPTPAHPYHLALGFLLQRYCGYLNHTSRVGDVMAESRGGAEDRLLKDSYQLVYQRGAWQHWRAAFFQTALTTKELKLKPKSHNIAGLQLADILAHPVKQAVLCEEGRLPEGLAGFAQQLVETVRPKFNRHLYSGRIEGYGTVLFPK